ncbi:hypothetical protein HMPREF1219_00834 [Corynebacterium pyruviciproducens ATCC BAA-1742]|uniref:YlxR domain-containing protein n=1 Tax=Corynebacterium pyruviciproducens ATCC BAA-1742 TaxID=1125779 RepID=S3A0K5_9CORY|nr:hypothetical protein HMPREF1219_00834 [Corynebacterium pyruviciproducens ATCC BAA-1742]
MEKTVGFVDYSCGGAELTVASETAANVDKRKSYERSVPTRRVRQRTCIATRKTVADTELLRVVHDQGTPSRVIPDPRRRLPGRGAWLAPTMEAYEIAEKRQAFGRALRIGRKPDTSLVREYILRAHSAELGNNNRDCPVVGGMTTTKKDPSN